MTAILGISAFFHDSAAAIIVDGRVVAAVQEERFSRIKNDRGFPSQAIAYCLEAAKLSPEQIDYVAFYEKPIAKFVRLLESYLTHAPVGFRSFAHAIPFWLEDKLHTTRRIRRTLRTDASGRRGGSPRGGYQKRVIYLEHHESHAASGFFPSPFEEAAILTVDGVGEWATACCGVGSGNRIRLHRQLRFPHSLGLLYSAFTGYCGFEVDGGEYKLMGLAPYGVPRFEQTILENLIDLRDDGSFRLDMSYFGYDRGLTMTTRKFHRLFGGPPRQPQDELTQRHKDLAASIQAVTEDVLLRMANSLHDATKLPNLCMAGGVALNCVANGRILRESPFENIWIQPAAGDAGGALGAAWFVWHQLLGHPRDAGPSDHQQGSLLGPASDAEEAAAYFRSVGQQPTRFPDRGALCERVAELLDAGKVVGWVQGRVEFGPRALGNRSILADPRRADMQAVLNAKVKRRESFRPFAPAVLADRAAEYFDLPAGVESPYMLLVAEIREDQRLPPRATEGVAGGSPQLRSPVPAVTHVDYSSRLQTVDRERNPRFHQLLTAFDRRTRCPMLINTSFNVRDEPIVCSAADAYRCYLATDIDALVVEDSMLEKG